MNFSLRIEYVIALLIGWTFAYTLFWAVILYAKGYLSAGPRAPSPVRMAPRSPAASRLDRVGMQEALSLKLAQEEQKANAATLRRQLAFLDRALADSESEPKS